MSLNKFSVHGFFLVYPKSSHKFGELREGLAKNWLHGCFPA